MLVMRNCQGRGVELEGDRRAVIGKKEVLGAGRIVSQLDKSMQ
jgi:hypothetical protein